MQRTHDQQQFKIAVFSDDGDPYSEDLASDLRAVSTGNITCNSYSSTFQTSNLSMFPEHYTIGQPQENFRGPIDECHSSENGYHFLFRLLL
jgi:hypothetical protein